MGTKHYHLCGQPIDVSSRWNGLSYVSELYDPNGDGTPLTHCPMCGEYIASPAELLTSFEYWKRVEAALDRELLDKLRQRLGIEEGEGDA
jgi:hypothetical protein